MRRTTLIVTLAVVCGIAGTAIAAGNLMPNPFEFTAQHLQYRPKPSPTIPAPPGLVNEPQTAKGRITREAAAQAMAKRGEQAGTFEVVNTLVVSPDLEVGAGFYSETGIPGVIVAYKGEDEQIIPFPVIGAPGPARLVGMKDNLILISQGRGYVVFDITTRKVTISDENANPGQPTVIR